jgi:chromosomal replication initiator protein
MNPHIYIGLPALVRLQYLNKSQNLILDVSVDDITGTSRVKRCAIARHYAVHFLRKYAHMHLKTIGEVLGNRNHSTILCSLETFNNSLIYPDFKFTAELIEERILALNQGKHE